MVNRESPKNLYRLLTCRDIDLHSLEGILLDHACLLDTYTMNRDAKILQYKKVLVDGCHWSSHKQNKKSNSKGKGGHLCCSDSFNWNVYKKITKSRSKLRQGLSFHLVLNFGQPGLQLLS